MHHFNERTRWLPTDGKAVAPASDPHRFPGHLTVVVPTCQLLSCRMFALLTQTDEDSKFFLPDGIADESDSPRPQFTRVSPSSPFRGSGGVLPSSHHEPYGFGVRPAPSAHVPAPQFVQRSRGRSASRQSGLGWVSRHRAVLTRRSRCCRTAVSVCTRSASRVPHVDAVAVCIPVPVGAVADQAVQ